VTVASVIASTEAARPASPASAATPSDGGGSGAGFAAALAAATEAAESDPGTQVPSGAPNPANLPSVSLATMVEAFARSTALGAPPPPAGVQEAGAGLAAVGAADTVGAAGAPASAAASGRGAEILAAGERYLGVPYVWGGTNPDVGFDCSGFVQRTFADLGISLPRVSVDQGRAGTAVASMDQARPGDLVFWNGDGSRPNHIGIYAGEGRMLVAPRTGDVVKYQDITREPHAIRRIV
jgi:peptidoglycan DL-endopeptidase CwlO